MATNAEILWILIWVLVASAALAHSIVAVRRSHFDATGEAIPVRSVLKARQWRMTVFPMTGVLLLTSAIGANAFRHLVTMPDWANGFVLVAMLSLSLSAAIYLFRVGS